MEIQKILGTQNSNSRLSLYHAHLQFMIGSIANINCPRSPPTPSTPFLCHVGPHMPSTHMPSHELWPERQTLRNVVQRVNNPSDFL